MLKEEKILLKCALAVSLLGIIILIILAETGSKGEEIVFISEAKEAEEGQEVGIQGEVKVLKDTPTITILTIQDETSEIKVIADKKGMETKLQKGMFVEVEGKIKLYQEEKEIEASTIRILKK
jgi:RecJ-like exonuclease